MGHPQAVKKSEYQRKVVTFCDGDEGDWVGAGVGAGAPAGRVAPGLHYAKSGTARV